MKVRTLLSIAAFASALAVPGFAFAQEEHMISGKAVPADQVAEVQAKCDELRKAPPAAAEAPAAAPAAEAPAAGTVGWTEDGTKIDVAKLTVALCDEGMFHASAM
ncbi:hypothetical protein [Devosia sp. A449]